MRVKERLYYTSADLEKAIVLREVTRWALRKVGKKR